MGVEIFVVSCICMLGEIFYAPDMYFESKNVLL